MSGSKPALFQQWSSLVAPIPFPPHPPLRSSAISAISPLPPPTGSAGVKSSSRRQVCKPTTHYGPEPDFPHYRKLGASPNAGRAIARRTKSKSGGALHICFSQSDQTSSSPSSTEPNSSDGGRSRMITAGGDEIQQSGKSDSESSSTGVPPEYSLDSGGLGDLSLLQTRRFWLGTSVAISVVLGGNFLGVTSSILNTNPKTSRSIRADLLFPVKRFKRCFETTHGFEFIYPASWVGDQRLLYRAAERAERERFLDLGLPSVAGQRSFPRRTSSTSTDPIVAFGPPGTDGELNVSVVVAPVNPSFKLQRIGGPEQAGVLILKQFIAPEGSKKVATLLNAEQRTDDGQLYYTLEYSVKGSSFSRHNLSVYASKDGSLYSLNAQTAETAWNGVREDFREIVKSFRLLG